MSWIWHCVDCMWLRCEHRRAYNLSLFYFWSSGAFYLWDKIQGRPIKPTSHTPHSTKCPLLPVACARLCNLRVMHQYTWQFTLKKVSAAQRKNAPEKLPQTKGQAQRTSFRHVISRRPHLTWWNHLHIGQNMGWGQYGVGCYQIRF